MNEVSALHIFYNGNLDGFLVYHLLPYLSKQKKEGAFLAYYFVRYWNGGKHIRLRLFGCKQVEKTQGLIDELLRNYSQKEPAVIQSQEAYLTHFKQIKHFHERNKLQGLEQLLPLEKEPCVRLSKYEFESHRYGDEAARKLAESHFCFSSQLTGILLRFSYKKEQSKITLLTYISLMTACSLKIPLKKMRDLFLHTNAIRQDLENGKEMIPDNFSSFSDQKEALNPIIRAFESWYEQVSVNTNREVLLSVQDQQPFVVELLQSWQYEMVSVQKQLKKYFVEGRLPDFPEHIMMIYLHMLFNRMGISYSIESYIHYLVGNIIQLITTEQQKYVTNTEV